MQKFRFFSLPIAALCALALLPGRPAVSQVVGKRLAILEFKGTKIESEVLENFSDEVRGGAVEGLAGRGVLVMTRESMMVLLKEMGKKECNEGDCEVETAKNIGADFVVSGSVARIDGVYVVTLKLFETAKANLLATNRIEAKRQLEVSRQLRQHGKDLAATNIGARPAPSLASPPAASAPLLSPPLSAPTPQPARGCASNQVAIPGGIFKMGSGLQTGWFPDETHKVTLSPYCIDRTEVTVTAYRACVRSGECDPPNTGDSCTWGQSGLDNQPINCVDWNQAKAYCERTGGRLPTEAEWEFAARGSDRRKYPWGNDDDVVPHCCMLRSSYEPDAGLDALKSSGPCPVGSRHFDVSPFGVLDMAGNVSEWTADGYDPYSAADQRNPQGSRRAGALRVFRGGNWNSAGKDAVRADHRESLNPGYRFETMGFRCARGSMMLR